MSKDLKEGGRQPGKNLGEHSRQKIQLIAKVLRPKMFAKFQGILRRLVRLEQREGGVSSRKGLQRKIKQSVCVCVRGGLKLK